MLKETRAKPKEDFVDVPDDVRLITARQVARIFGISESKVTMMEETGSLPTSVRVGKRSKRWRLSDIIRYSRQLK